MMTEYNPNYEFAGGSCSIQDLKEVDREALLLVKALGQGAFGEVYQGILKSKSDASEINVAVKTLPELSTNQGKGQIKSFIASLVRDQSLKLENGKDY